MKGVSRRTVVVGTAWAVPAVVVAGPAPHAAASPVSPPERTITATIEGTACKYPSDSGSYPNGVRFQLTFTNPFKTTVPVTLDTITLATGETARTIEPSTAIPVRFGQPTITPVGYPFTITAGTSTQVAIRYHYTDPGTGQLVNERAGPTSIDVVPSTSCPF